MLDKIKSEVVQSLSASDLDVDKIALDGVTMRIGGKVLNLTVSQSTPAATIEQEIREELKVKLKDKLTALGAFIDKKMSEAFGIVESVKSEYARKEKILVDKIQSSNVMPQITWSQAERGLSVIPTKDGVGWLVRKTYWPKFLDNKVIDPKFQKKMITNVIVYIETQGKKVVNVTVRKLAGLGTFDHYHRNCWGNWTWQKSVDGAEDILAMADQAMAVLERVNSMSVAVRNPIGLPRIDTLTRHTDGSLDEISEEMVGRNLTRTGTVVDDNENVWSTT